MYSQLKESVARFQTEQNVIECLHKYGTQSNEGLNMSVSRYIPKFKHYGTSMSLNTPYTLPFPKDMVALIWVCIFGWTTSKVFTHHVIELKPSNDRVSTNLLVELMSLISLISFFQSSLSGCVALVVKNLTAA